MPVEITIEDGPPAGPWLSPAIRPGTLSTASGGMNMFTDASVIRQGNAYDFAVNVKNVGTAAAETPPFNPVAFLLLQPSVAPAAQGLAPDGQSRVEFVVVNGQSRVRLSPTPATFVQFTPYEAAFGPNDAVRFSPDGLFLLLVQERTNPSGVTEVAITIVVTKLGHPSFGTEAFRPGTVIASWAVRHGAGPADLAGVGLGFSPDGRYLFIRSTDQGQSTVTPVVLADGMPFGSRVVFPQIVKPADDVVDLLMSPDGTLLVTVPALAPQPRSFGFYRIPHSITVVSLILTGMPMPALTRTEQQLDFMQVKLGFEAFRFRQGAGAREDYRDWGVEIPAVHVFLWIDRATGVFDTRTARQFPRNQAITWYEPSGYIDRIPNGPLPQGVQREALIRARWTAPVPVQNVHYCAFAEACTHPDVVNGDPRRRTGTSLSLAEPQIAQRNLAIV